MRHTFVGRHADTLANGRPVAPGEVVDVDPLDHAAHIDAGLLVEHTALPSEQQAIRARAESRKATATAPEES